MHAPSFGDVAVDPSQGRRVGIEQRHLKAIERRRDPLAGGLEKSFLPGPASEERVRLLRRFECSKLGILPRRKESPGHIEQIIRSADPFDVDPDLASLGKGVHRQAVGVGKVEIDSPYRRLPPRGVDKLDRRRMAIEIPAEERAKCSAADDEPTAKRRRHKPVGACNLLIVQQLTQLLDDLGRRVENDRPDIDVHGRG